MRRALLMLLTAGCSLDSAGLGSGEARARGETDVTEVRDTSVADVGVDDTQLVDAFAADTLLADTALADTSLADTALADTPLDMREADVIDTSVPDTNAPCAEPGGVIFGGHCYFVLAGPFEFAAARDACNMRMPPAHLVSITSPAEQAAANRGSGDRWIGLFKDAPAPVAKASFRWVTGEPSTPFDNWAAGDPNGGHNCARMNGAGQWADFTCATLYPAVCERD